MLRTSVLLALLLSFGLLTGCDAIQQAIQQGQAGGGSGAGGGGVDSMNDTDWATLKAGGMAKVRVASGYGAPTLVAGSVNSTGWEDSASISPDGNSLYFAYVPCDFHGLAAKAKMDLNKFAQYKRGPSRGNLPEFAFDTFVSRRAGTGFSAPQKHSVSVNTTPPQTSESGMMEASGEFFYNSNHPASPTDWDVDLWRASASGVGQSLPFNANYDDQDPHFDPASRTLFFWSEKRPGGTSNNHKHLWMAKEGANGAWSNPVCLAAPINTKNSDSWQCHLTADGHFIFTSNRGGDLAIYKSKRLGDNQWAEPEKLVWFERGGPVRGVAEPSMTADGRELYFCVLFENENGSFDLDIASVTKL